MKQKQERIAIAIATVIMAAAIAILVVPIGIICAPGDVDITFGEGVLIGAACLYSGYAIIDSKK